MISRTDPMIPFSSGFPKIIAAWKETNWGEPQLINKLDVDEVELVLPVPSPKSTVKTVNETVKVSGIQEKILQFLHDNENITYEEIAEKDGCFKGNSRKAYQHPEENRNS